MIEYEDIKIAINIIQSQMEEYKGKTIKYKVIYTMEAKMVTIMIIAMRNVILSLTHFPFQKQIIVKNLDFQKYKD